jgi:hypothetical protein
MMRTLFIAISILCSSNLFGQRIARSSIGCYGSSYKGNINLVSSSLTSSPILLSTSTSNGITIQSRPFVQLGQASNTKPIEIMLYPNPSSDLVYVKTTETITSVQVVDVSGRVCLNSDQTNLSLGHLTNGVYTIEVKMPNNNYYSQKIILNK